MVDAEPGHKDGVLRLPLDVPHVGLRPMDEEKGGEKQPTPFSAGSIQQEKMF